MPTETKQYWAGWLACQRTLNPIPPRKYTATQVVDWWRGHNAWMDHVNRSAQTRRIGL